VGLISVGTGVLVAVVSGALSTVSDGVGTASCGTAAHPASIVTKRRNNTTFFIITLPHHFEAAYAIKSSLHMHSPYASLELRMQFGGGEEGVFVQLCEAGFA